MSVFRHLCCAFQSKSQSCASTSSSDSFEVAAPARYLGQSRPNSFFVEFPRSRRDDKTRRREENRTSEPLGALLENEGPLHDKRMCALRTFETATATSRILCIKIQPIGAAPFLRCVLLERNLWRTSVTLCGSFSLRLTRLMTTRTSRPTLWA